MLSGTALGNLLGFPVPLSALVTHHLFLEQKKALAAKPALIFRRANREELLGGFGLHLVKGKRQAGLVTVRRILMQNALADRLVDRRKRRV